MMLWAIATGLAAMAAAFVLAPMLRGTGDRVDHAEGALAIFADQIAEVDREAAQGLISADEAEAAKVEIKRRMLAVARGRGAGDTRHGGVAVLGVLALAVPVLAGVIYWQLGSPGQPSQPFEARAEERAENARIDQLTTQLRQTLLEDPNGGETEGWVILGQTYMRLGRPGDAALAFGRVIEREDATSAVLTQFAEAQVMAEGGVVTNRVAVVVERALMMDADNPAASFYRARWLIQEGRDGEAEAMLVERVEREVSFQPWMNIFVGQINQLRAARGAEPMLVEDFLAAPPMAPGPSREDIEAAAEMSTEDRAAMVASMVEGLAARLAEEPDDLDGWLRLGRAYAVLGRQDEALEAFQAADGLLEGLASDDPRRGAVADGLAANGG